MRLSKISGFAVILSVLLLSVMTVFAESTFFDQEDSYIMTNTVVSSTGIIKGRISSSFWTDAAVVGSDEVNSSLMVWFVPSGVSIDWSENITFNSSISGSLAGVDADDAGIACAAIDYIQPTSRKYIAKNGAGANVYIYGIETDSAAGNAGCFAGRIPAGTYDVYA
ncbi:MAG: hypothetical protein V1911_02605 [Candidatus Micrarchaeota archaeon]